MKSFKSVSLVAATSTRGKHTLPDLQYDYAALEPYISADIMRTHHLGHHATYVKNLNEIEEKLDDAVKEGSAKKVIALATGLKFNGGGHINHSLFWTLLTPNGGGEPSGELAETINRDFGSFDKMVQQLSLSANSLQGSGWAWLGYNKYLDILEVAACVNQDPLWPTTGNFYEIFLHQFYLNLKKNI